MTEEKELGEIKKEEVKIVYEPYKSDIERSMAINEANLLCNMIGSTYQYIHFDNGNNGKSEPKVTKSTTISAFDGQQITSFIQRLVTINNRLVQENK